MRSLILAQPYVVLSVFDDEKGQESATVDLMKINNLGLFYNAEYKTKINMIFR